MTTKAIPKAGAAKPAAKKVPAKKKAAGAATQRSWALPVAVALLALLALLAVLVGGGLLVRALAVLEAATVPQPAAFVVQAEPPPFVVSVVEGCDFGKNYMDQLQPGGHLAWYGMRNGGQAAVRVANRAINPGKDPAGKQLYGWWLSVDACGSYPDAVMVQSTSGQVVASGTMTPDLANPAADGIPYVRYRTQDPIPAGTYTVIWYFSTTNAAYATKTIVVAADGSLSTPGGAPAAEVRAPAVVPQRALVSPASDVQCAPPDLNIGSSWSYRVHVKGGYTAFASDTATWVQLDGSGFHGQITLGGGYTGSNGLKYREGKIPPLGDGAYTVRFMRESETLRVVEFSVVNGRLNCN